MFDYEKFKSNKNKEKLYAKYFYRELSKSQYLWSI